MFFRRRQPRTRSFAERLDALRGAGYSVSAAGAGRARVTRGECAAEVEEDSGVARLAAIGVLMEGEIGVIVDVGYQKTLQTPSGRRAPALASHLKALHAFGEDLRQGLETGSLYNESLGTVNQLHNYDRVAGREG